MSLRRFDNDYEKNDILESEKTMVDIKFNRKLKNNMTETIVELEAKKEKVVKIASRKEL
jgi:hypothetical protein